jgi:hypothetical protein
MVGTNFLRTRISDRYKRNGTFSYSYKGNVKAQQKRKNERRHARGRKEEYEKWKSKASQTKKKQPRNKSTWKPLRRRRLLFKTNRAADRAQEVAKHRDAEEAQEAKDNALEVRLRRAEAVVAGVCSHSFNIRRAYNAPQRDLALEKAASFLREVEIQFEEL